MDLFINSVECSASAIFPRTLADNLAEKETKAVPDRHWKQFLQDPSHFLGDQEREAYLADDDKLAVALIAVSNNVILEGIEQAS